jgi:hypothetical protein
MCRIFLHGATFCSVGGILKLPFLGPLYRNDDCEPPRLPFFTPLLQKKCRFAYIFVKSHPKWCQNIPYVLLKTPKYSYGCHFVKV